MQDKRSKTLGEFIKAARTERGLTLGAVAEAVGTSRGALSEIESGLRSPKADTLQRIARALDIDWEDLYALAGYGRPESLPSFGPYLRSKYGDQLSANDLKQLESYFRDITEGKSLAAF